MTQTKLSKENKEYLEKKQKEVVKQKDLIKVRYYFWEWNTLTYGWRQLGYNDGYSSISELKRDQKYNIENSLNWKILKAEVIESKLQ